MKNPVLLIHGILRKSYVFDNMAKHLTKEGWEVHRIDLTPNDGTVGLDKLALQIEEYVNKNLKTTFDLIGFSMGGIVSRYYLQKLGGIEKIERFITISSPHNGTLMAYLLPFIGVEQMRPNSPFLQDLNKDIHQLKKVNFTSIWTPFDLMILPPQSSQLPIGKEIKVPILAHAIMPSADLTIKAVVKQLIVNN